MKAVGLFAMWQTKLYDPSEAKDGIVPKNTRGQINLWTPSHLPRKCVHVLEADAAMIARKLGIDYATAVVGFDFSGMNVTPKLNGIIIAADNAGILKEGLKHHFKVAKSRTDRVSFATLCKHWRILIRGSISALKFQHREKSVSLRRVIVPIIEEKEQCQSQSCQEKREQGEIFPSEHRMRSIINDGHVHRFTASFSASGEWIQMCACGVSSTD
jgi:xeroderma pigmentosum group C-complementing protein